MKTTNKTLFLTVEVAKSLINKTIVWRAPMDEENWDDYDTPKFFGGKCIIKKINSDKRLELVCETISGNDLSYAILENEELQPVNGQRNAFQFVPRNWRQTHIHLLRLIQRGRGYRHPGRRRR